MAKIEAVLEGNFDNILSEIEAAVFKSASASLEDYTDIRTDESRCSVRAYERSSFSCGGRVGMSITLLESGSKIFLSAICFAGTRCLVRQKTQLNTFGQDNFLNTIVDVVNKYNAHN